MNELLVALITWIHAVSGLPVPTDLPEVKRADTVELCAVVHGGDACNPLLPTLAGAYDDEGTILLLHAWKPDNAYDLSLLVHELAHFMQDRSGASYACLGAREREAYRIQDRFLQSMGTSLQQHGIGMMFLAGISRCRDAASRPAVGGR